MRLTPRFWLSTAFFTSVLMVSSSSDSQPKAFGAQNDDVLILDDSCVVAFSNDDRGTSDHHGAFELASLPLHDASDLNGKRFTVLEDSTSIVFEGHDFDEVNARVCAAQN